MGRIAMYAAAEKSASTTMIVRTKPTMAASGLGNPATASMKLAAGPWNAAATARIHEARL
jgi:hypothetical protein